MQQPRNHLRCDSSNRLKAGATKSAPETDKWLLSKYNHSPLSHRQHTLESQKNGIGFMVDIARLSILSSNELDD